MFARIYVCIGVGGNSTTYVFLMYPIYNTNTNIHKCYHNFLLRTFKSHKIIKITTMITYKNTKIQETSGIVGTGVIHPILIQSKKGIDS